MTSEAAVGASPQGQSFPHFSGRDVGAQHWAIEVRKCVDFPGGWGGILPLEVLQGHQPGGILLALQAACMGPRLSSL